MKQIAALTVGIALLAGCGNDRAPTAVASRAPAAGAQSQAAADRGLDASVLRDLAALRRATAPFQDFSRASNAGWSAKITSCMFSSAGTMGFHYGNTNLINGSVSVTNPQLLLYEPEKNGRLRLVAVEYIIPYTFHSRDAAPPVLFGQKFQQNDMFQLWGLHAWVWKDNPNGIFAPWNPSATCENTTDIMPVEP